MPTNTANPTCTCRMWIEEGGDITGPYFAFDPNRRCAAHGEAALPTEWELDDLGAIENAILRDAELGSGEPRARAFQIKIHDAKHLAPLTSAYLLDALGYAAQVERDGTAIYYWNIARGPMPNLCNCGVAVEIELVYA